MNIIKTVVIILALGGCSLSNYSIPYQPPEDASPIYKKGWEEGCKSGFSVYGNTVYQAMYSYTQDIELIDNSTYSKAWTESFNYCRSYINRYLVDGFWWGEGFDSSDASAFNTGGLRNDKITLQGDTTLFPTWRTMQTPGWGTTAWGASAPSNDWLGRSGADAPDWLGRTGKYK